MGLREFRAKFRGREFWRNINRFIGIGLYTVVIVGIMVFPKYLIYVFFGMAIVVPSYIALFINHLREMEKRGKGNKVIEGWITHAYGVGERVYFYPIKFELVEKLSPDDLKSVEQYVKNLKQQSKKLGLEGFKQTKEPEPPKQLEHKQIEAMNREERMKFDEEEKLEHDGFLNEHKKIIILEQVDKKKSQQQKTEINKTNDRKTEKNS